jgi:hypothetical protein
MHVSKCEFDGCDKKDNCERFVNATGTVINFKEICYKHNYKWIMKIKEEEEVEECIKELPNAEV